MGEAADLHRGVWPANKPIGAHYSVTSSLPAMLSILATHGLKSTYFIEAWNCEPAHYPSVIQSLQAQGHEIGFHAYQHEVWKLLDEETELANLEKSVRNAEAVGVAYKGFRPPGGLVTERTLGLMRERGFTYLSPAAQRPAIVDGIAMVPFQWESIDAYFYMGETASLRTARGDGQEVLSPRILRERLCRRVDEVIAEGGYLALLFHPFLQVDEEKMGVMREVVAYVKGKEEEVWIAPCRDVAEWILAHPDSFGTDPGWDNAEWKKN